MHNPIKYPNYEENGKNILTLDANNILIYLYKIYVYKKENKELNYHLMDTMNELCNPLNLDETEIFNAITELKQQGLVIAYCENNQFFLISLTPKAIAYYEHSVGREVRKLMQNIIQFL